jgi:hypothetical protein
MTQRTPRKDSIANDIAYKLNFIKQLADIWDENVYRRYYMDEGISTAELNKLNRRLDTIISKLNYL